MQQQQDKDFDARLREKMQDFSVTPPAGLWESIDGKVNGPSVPQVKGTMSAAAWLKIAASVCLLAAAGIWLYSYDSPFKNDMISIRGKKDSITSPEPKVTILNKSRSRKEAGSGEAGQAGNTPEGNVKEESRQAGNTLEETGSKGSTLEETGKTGSAPEQAGQTEPAQPVSEQTEGNGNATGQPGESRANSRRSEAVLAAASQKRQPEKGRQTGDPMALAAAGPGSKKERLADEHAGANIDLLPDGEGASSGRAKPDPDLEPIARAETGIEPLALEPSADAEPSPNMRSLAGEQETPKEGRGILAAAFGRSGTKQAGTSAGEDGKKNSLVPKELREVSGVGEALNLVASTIDRSEDKFIRVRKDEESGKWDGVRLDLGIVTISYNKPEKKSRQERN